MAIFQGSRIGTKELTITVPDRDETGISAVFASPGEISGQYYSPHGASTLTLTFGDSSQIGGSTLYIDGEKQAASVSGAALVTAVAAGHHHWQFTSHLPKPLAVNVARTANFAGGASIYFDAVAGADLYQLQSSTDGGQSWQTAAKAESSPIKLAGLKNAKIHVRLIATNAEQSSDPGDACPIYVSDQPPAPPDGLYLHLSAGRVDASWGQELGVGEYHLFRRKLGETDSNWKRIYAGVGQSFADQNVPGVVAPNELPGPENAGTAPSVIYEYAVAAANGNGQGSLSQPATTDPSDWRVWWPPNQPEQFKRQSAYWQPPYVPANQMPPPQYP
jgi:hypothetical protein